MKRKFFGFTAFFLFLAFSFVQIPSYAANESGRVRLVALGQCVGIRLFSDGIIVTGFQKLSYNGNEVCPAKKGGLKTGDIIVSADGSPISSVSELVTVLKGSNSEEITLCFRRDGVMRTTKIQCIKNENGELKMGCYVRDSTAGLGTLTFYDPQTGLVAGLGHPICDADSGIIIPVKEGSLINASVIGAKKGVVGSPGSLLGEFSSFEPIADLFSNTQTGIYAQNKTISISDDSMVVEMAEKNEVHAGNAQILCTLDASGPKLYSVRILRVDNLDDEDTRDYEIKVTDKALIEKTGGIVQGMSGSPILQDGRIIGAVTHVFINDPQKGYGIYIGAMRSDGLAQLKDAA